MLRPPEPIPSALVVCKDLEELMTTALSDRVVSATRAHFRAGPDEDRTGFSLCEPWPFRIGLVMSESCRDSSAGRRRARSGPIHDLARYRV